MKLLILTFLFCLCGSVFPNQQSISGVVKDKLTGQPMPGVNVLVQGSTAGSITDRSGRFSIGLKRTGVYSLRISRMGYRTEMLENIKITTDAALFFEIELEETAIELDPIVVLGGKNEQRMDDANVSLSVVTAREIKQRNPVNLVQALETASGVHFVGEQINIRGSTGYSFGAGNKVLLLLDGIPVYASDTGQFNWDMLPPLDIKQVEILKGAGSTLWGASALGGVINVVTRDPSSESRLLFSWTFGKYDRPAYKIWEWTDHSRLYYTREDVSFSRKIGRLGLRVSGGRYYTTGYAELGKARKYNAVAKLNYQWKNGFSGELYASFSSIYRGFFIQWKGPNNPYEVDEAYKDNYAQTNQFTLYAKLTAPVSSKLAVHFRASMVRSLMGNQFGESADFNPAIGQGGELSAYWLPGGSHSITFGLQFQHDAGSARFFGSHQGYFIGPYIQNEWQIRDNVRFTAGLRYDRYQLAGGIKEDLLSPRFGLNWKPWPATSIRASLGSGFRAATLVERFLELTIMNFKILANPDLEAEYAWAADIGFRHYINENWLIDFSFFNNSYRNLIEAHLDLIRGQIQFRNIDRALIRGFEASMDWSDKFTVLGLTAAPGFRLGITAMHHEDLKWNEPLTYRPKRLINVKTWIDLSAFRLETDYRYASKIEEVKIYPVNERVPMHFWDMRFSYMVGDWTFQAGIINLFNYNYAPMESNLMPMRTFTLSVRGEL